MAAALSAVLALGAWNLRPEPPRPQVTGTRRRGFGALFTSYTLEGVGYIIAGTFLVAAISGPLGSSAWILVGLSAVLSPVLIKPRRYALPIALAVQAVGIALPALVDGTALIAVVLFGGTFIGPLVATPLLHNGYDQALLLAAAIVALAAITAPAPPSRHRAATRTPPRRTPAAPAD